MFHRCHKANSWLGHAQNGCPNAAHKDSFSVSVYCILFDTMFNIHWFDASGCYSTSWMLFYSFLLYIFNILYTHDIDMDWHMIGGFWRLLKGYSSPRQRYCHLNPQWTPLTNPSDPSGLFFAISLFETIHTCPQVLLLWKPCISWQHPFHTRAKCHVSQCCIAASLRKACSGLIIFEILLTCTDLYWLTAKTLPLSADVMKVMTLSQAPGEIILFSQCPYNSCSHIVATYFFDFAWKVSTCLNEDCNRLHGS